MNRGAPVLAAVLLLVLLVGLAGGAAAKPYSGFVIRPESPAGGKVTGDQWLLLIGISDYQHWSRLPTAVNDARAIRDVLLKQYYFDADHLVELYDEQATRENIIAAFRTLARQLKPDDSLLIYYAGHGRVAPGNGEGSWIPVDGTLDNPSTWVSNWFVMDYMRFERIKAGHILLVADSCFSGDFFAGHAGRMPYVSEEVIRKAYGLRSRQALVSGGMAPVGASSAGGNSAFTHHLLTILADNKEKFLLPSAFFAELKSGLFRNIGQVPLIGPVAGTGGHSAGELVLFRKRYFVEYDLFDEEKSRKAELDLINRIKEDAAADVKTYEQTIVKLKDELAATDERISRLRKDLADVVDSADPRLQKVFAMVKQRDVLQERIEDFIKKQAAVAENVRQEMANLEIEKKARRIELFIRDILRYEEIVAATKSRAEQDAAWRKIVSQYPEAAQVPPGNVPALRLLVIHGMKKDRVWSEPVTGMDFVWVEGGCFKMGDTFGNGLADEVPVHEVCVDGFWLGRFETTQSQWEKIMGEKYSHFYHVGKNYPAERVSWEDAQKFIQGLGRETEIKYRLPTEAEWEYACRSGGERQMYCGGDDLEEVAWYRNRRVQNTHPVGGKQPNGLGLYDMNGNVWEWVQDRYDPDYYRFASRQNPLGPARGATRVFRGGSWTDTGAFVRATIRGNARHTDRNVNIGFRVVLPPLQ